MIKIIVLFILIQLISCAKKDVKIPLISLDAKEEISNHSKIWMFYGENGTLDVNEKNRISSTNWLFNIDKKLMIKDVLPEASRLLIKHNEKSPHNHGGVYNYYSFINTKNNKLSFYKFDEIKYQFVSSLNIPDYTTNKDTLFIKVNKSTIQAKFDESKIIQLAFDQNLTFQDYMEKKASYLNLLTKKSISVVEYIYSD
jgi:hypothetical protein